MPSVRIKRGTRAQLDAAAVAATLAAGEPYLITDESRIAVGLSTTAYQAAGKEGEIPPAPITHITTATHDILATGAGSYHRFEFEGDKTVTFRPDGTEALPTDGEWHLRNAATTGNLTIALGSGVVATPPKGGSLVLEPGDTVTVKRAAIDTFDVFGSTL